jgi:TRAP-type C4-dicarboxylate transport system substrate-binding protein
MRTLCALALAAAVGLVGCSGGRQGASDKAGGAEGPPTVLRLAYVDWVDNSADAQLLQGFADRVDSLSNGQLRVQIVNKPEYKAPDEELAVARGVRRGRFGLGWITTRRWDDLGVKTFQALHTPFLITDNETLRAVARDRLAKRMLLGVQGYGVVGLALVPRALLHPEAQRPLLGPADYDGMQFLVARSRATDDLLAAYGAKAVYTVDSVTAGPPGAVQPLRDSDGVETANVTLSPRFGTLFANRAVFDRLSDGERTFLRRAAGEMVERSLAELPTEEAGVRLHCETGSIALARPADLAALEKAARPVTAELERDRQTKELVGAIQRLSASVHPAASLVVPRSCRPASG